ncbi:hypothetical protein JHW43_005648 [Diplocarpon mali]|nr:hypothetical protein JHW43_005648 [Diplocarpon mali]
MDEYERLDEYEDVVDISAFSQDTSVTSKPIMYSPTWRGQDPPVAEIHLNDNSNEAVHSVAKTAGAGTGDWMAQHDSFHSDSKDWEQRVTNASEQIDWDSKIEKVDFAKERALRDHYKAQAATATRGTTKGLTPDEIFALEVAREAYRPYKYGDLPPLVPMSAPKQGTYARDTSYAVQLANATNDYIVAQQAHLARGPRSFESADAEIAYQMAMEDASPGSTFDGATAFSPSTAPIGGITISRDTAANNRDADSSSSESLITYSANNVSKCVDIDTSSSDGLVVHTSGDKPEDSASELGPDDGCFPVYFDDVPGYQYPYDPRVRAMCKRVCREVGRSRNHDVCWVRNVFLSMSPDNPHSDYTRSHHNGTRDSLKVWYARNLEVDFGYALDSDDPNPKPRETAVIYVGPGEEMDPTRMGLWRKGRPGDEVVWNQDAMLLMGEHVSD